MKKTLGILLLLVLLPLVVSRARLLPPNADGVSMAQWYTIVRDVDAAKKFWTMMGGTPVKIDGVDAMKFPGVFVFLSQGNPTGETVGSVINHIGFHVPNGAELAAKLIDAGVKTDPKAGTRGPDANGSSWGNVYSPDGVKVEILDSSRTTAAIGLPNVPGPSPLTGSISPDHIHFFLPGSSATAAQAWYAKTFGSKSFSDPVPRPNDPVIAGNLPGVELKFSNSTSPVVPTKGRALDHVGFEVKNLEAFCKQLEANGVKLDEPYSKTRHKGYASAELTDPWGTTIVLTEGLSKF
jgi:catechol 2,3-dioxygenase-like lactoylglutathione lyase family enzyme